MRPAAPKEAPIREPLRKTLTRTGLIAAIAGAAMASRLGGLRHWPMATLLMLWPSFGGHYVEVFFLNGMRPRLPPARTVRAAARMVAWFIGGVVLALGMNVTASTLGILQLAHWPAWWAAGAAFVAIELAAHFALQMRGRASFYNGRG